MISIAQIASELQGYDPQCLHADDASALLERLTEYPVADEHRLPLARALGQVLAQDIPAPPGGAAPQGMPFLLQKGERLTPAALGLAASLGLTTLQVLRPLRVAYLSLVPETEHDPATSATSELPLRPCPLKRCQASNRYALMGLLQRLGIEVFEVSNALEISDISDTSDTSDTFDALITCQAWDGLPLPVAHDDCVLWHLAMQPGGIMAVARLSDARLLFQLPSDPVAAMVAFWVLLRPALLRMMGANVPAVPLLQARCCQAIEKQPGYSAYPCGIVFTAPDGNLQVSVVGHAPEALCLSAIAHANGLIVLRHEQGSVAVGDLVEVMMLDSLS